MQNQSIIFYLAMPVAVVVHLSSHCIAAVLCLSECQHPVHSAQCMMTANAVSMAFTP